MEPRDVLNFWFGALGSAEHNQTRREWFQKDAAFDSSIRQRFGDAIELALDGGLANWRDTVDGALAEIIVLDQFTRNAFRDTPRAFAGDGLALNTAQQIVATGRDRALPGVRRQFVYLPFEHAEDLAMQVESMRLFTGLAADEPALADLVDWARRHYEIVERFGRFPHRNEILKRQSTAAELAFLREPGSRF